MGSYNLRVCLDFLKVARSLLVEWTWHERLLSLAARQIYRRNFPPVALSNQKQRYESTRQSSQITHEDETGNLFSNILAIVCISVFPGPRTLQRSLQRSLQTHNIISKYMYFLELMKHEGKSLGW